MRGSVGRGKGEPGDRWGGCRPMPTQSLQLLSSSAYAIVIPFPTNERLGHTQKAKGCP